MKLDQFVQAANFQICGGSEHQWNCYPNGQFLDIASCDGLEIGDCVFNRKTQEVYEVSVYNEGSAFLWIGPNVISEVNNESKNRGLDPTSAWDDVKFIKVSSEELILSIVRKFAMGEDLVDLTSYEAPEDSPVWAFPTANDYAKDHGIEQCMNCEDCNCVDETTTCNDAPTEKSSTEYDVAIDVRYTFSVNADAMEDAIASAKDFVKCMKPSALSPEGVCWMDTYSIKETVSRLLVVESIVD